MMSLRSLLTCSLVALTIGACTPFGLPTAVGPSPTPGVTDEVPGGPTVPITVTGAAPRDLVGSRWLLREIVGGSDLTGVEAVLHIDPDRISGTSGCNTYSASLMLGDDTLSLGPVAVTAMACHEPRDTIEGQFLQALTQGRAWAVDDAELEVRGADGAVSLILDRMPADDPGTPMPETTPVATPDADATDAPPMDGNAVTVTGMPAASLVGSKWLLVSLPGLAGLNDVVATLELNREAYGGSSGCNRYGGSLTVTEAGFILGPAASTLIACTEPQATVEAGFLQALWQTVAWRVNGDQLEWLDASGQVLATFERQ